MPTRSVRALLPALAGLVIAAGCTSPTPSTPPADTPAAQTPARKATVTRSPYGKLPDGADVELYTLTNAAGVEARVITYGGIIVSLKVPDRAGALDDVVLGMDNLEGYLKGVPYFGAIVGRYGNRIGNARFTVDGKTYTLAANNGKNALHGGLKGFDKVVWKAEPFERPGEVGLVLTHVSPDGDQGYPGALSTRITYTLSDKNSLAFDYEATTDKATPVNLTQHSYFNLAGAGARDVLGHELTLNADRYTPVDATLIPTGELAPVEGTPFDFRTSTAIGARIDAPHPQIKFGGGYDHNYVLNRQGDGLSLAARVYEPTTGRVVEVTTTEPGVQFYTGNFLDGTITGKGGRVYQKRYGFCLETQHYPDSPNKPSFPSAIVTPDKPYRSQTVFTFSTR
jgi:aldose 1-epimerase